MNRKIPPIAQMKTKKDLAPRELSIKKIMYLFTWLAAASTGIIAFTYANGFLVMRARLVLLSLPSHIPIPHTQYLMAGGDILLQGFFSVLGAAFWLMYFIGA